MLNYLVILSDVTDDTVLVRFPDVPEAFTFGADRKEVLLRGVDGLEARLSFCVDTRKPRPVPSAPRQRPLVRPSALECAKLGVHKTTTCQGIKKFELARRMGWHLPQVNRLFDLKHATRFDQIEAAARVLGRHVEVALS